MALLASTYPTYSKTANLAALPCESIPTGLSCLLKPRFWQRSSATSFPPSSLASWVMPLALRYIDNPYSARNNAVQVFTTSLCPSSARLYAVPSPLFYLTIQTGIIIKTYTSHNFTMIILNLFLTHSNCHWSDKEVSSPSYITNIWSKNAGPLQIPSEWSWWVGIQPRHLNIQSAHL